MKLQILTMANRCNPKAYVLATLSRSKKEIGTHRKKIQKRLPGKQQSCSFVYGFGNLRVEECVLPVLTRHCCCVKVRRGKKLISFLFIIQTLSKDSQEQFHRLFPPESTAGLCTAALLWEFPASQKCKSQRKQRT